MLLKSLCRICTRKNLLQQNRATNVWAVLRENPDALLLTSRKITYQHFRPVSTGAGSGTQRAGTTVDQDEIDRFSCLADNWWNEIGEFGALHTMNALRIPLIRDALAPSLSDKPVYLPLNGVKILDVGCGGGILSEPLTRLGAEVTGLDASEENIRIAKLHASHDNHILPRLRYECETVENLCLQEPEKYDGVVASEIIEHVADQKQFVTSCCQLVKPGGSIFFTTMNRTQLSYWLAVFAAERILKIVPEGIHDWNKFISPEELQTFLQKENFQTVEVRGMTMNPLNLRWCWFPDTSVNYALHAIKMVPASNVDTTKGGNI